MILNQTISKPFETKKNYYRLYDNRHFVEWNKVIKKDEKMKYTVTG